ncbi:MAG TPA: hypothetical protein VFT01_10685 [Homoserinimonas sp.]|nr:hypothetical protein [Homoserinimonas sp.]
MSLRLPGEGPSAPTCSRAGCSSDADWNVNWRNPKIHGPERVKVWLACAEHREYLSEYLAARDFPVVVTPLDEHLDRLPPSANGTVEGTP